MLAAFCDLGKVRTATQLAAAGAPGFGSGRRHFSLVSLGSRLVIEHIVRITWCMELGTETAGERTERSHPT